ncbi:MAG: ABC transporter ATP-binding protein [Coriobacteriales bacterium]|nr:ABC transporter ATP-binding protein [Coriobacteriales bacterium]
MIFGEKFRQKYALSQAGEANVKRGTFWTVVTNLLVMGGIGFLFMLMQGYMATLVDGAPLPAALPFVVGVVAFVALSFFTHWQQYHYTYSVVYDEVGLVRTNLAERLRKLPLSFFAHRDLAELTETMMSDVDRLEHVWSHVLGYLYGGYISTAIIAVIVLVYDWRLAIACLWGVPVAFGLLFGSRRVFGTYAARAKASGLDVADGIQETLECMREIRATNQEARYLAGVNGKIDEFENRITAAELRTGIFVNSASVIMRLGMATTVLVGAGLILSGSVDFMTLFMFLLMVTRVYAPFDQSLALIAEVFVSDVSVQRLNEVFNTPVAGGAEEFAPQGHDVTFHNVGFAYDEGGETTLSDVSFTAEEGEVTALVGPSGSGKSTCARLAARLWDHDSGTLSVGGVEVLDVDPETLMGSFSMVFQDVTLFDDTVMENIRLGRRGATDEEVLAAAAAANCDEFVARLADGYATQIGENGARLSGGERQRISIARALLKDAPIVLLDEATASLDVENETKVQAALSRLLVGKTVLVIAHRMRTVMGANKVVVLQDGRVVEQGAPAELLAADGTFARMVRLQSKSAGWSV